MLRGEPGTTVEVTYLRDGEKGELKTKLNRRSVRIKDVPLAMTIGEQQDGVG